MSQERFNVIFTGKFVEGFDPHKAMEMIASMFKVSPERVRAAFSKGAGAVIASTNDKDKARRYAVGMKKAGAICTVHAQQEPTGQSKPQAQPAGDAQGVRINIGPTDITLTTISCPRLTGMAGADNALNVNRKDSSRVEFKDISAISVYNATDGAEDYHILFFLSSIKRPFGALCMNIVFGDFPGVTGPNLLSSLRNFLTFIYARNSRIIFDSKTFEFIAGGQIQLFVKDEIKLATALYSALPDEAKTTEILSGYGVTQTSQYPVPEETRDVCPKCGENRKPASRACPRCGLLFSKWKRKKK